MLNNNIYLYTFSLLLSFSFSLSPHSAPVFTVYIHKSYISNYFKLQRGVFFVVLLLLFSVLALLDTKKTKRVYIIIIIIKKKQRIKKYIQIHYFLLFKMCSRC
jgi:hypothetical protein